MKSQIGNLNRISLSLIKNTIKGEDETKIEDKYKKFTTSLTEINNCIYNVTRGKSKCNGLSRLKKIQSELSSGFLKTDVSNVNRQYIINARIEIDKTISSLKYINNLVYPATQVIIKNECKIEQLNKELQNLDKKIKCNKSNVNVITKRRTSKLHELNNLKEQNDRLKENVHGYISTLKNS